MSASLSEIQTELKAQLKKFCEQKMESLMEEDDEKGVFRLDLYRQLGELGYCGMTLPEDFGGMGLGCTDQCVALEELARCSVSYAVTISVSTMVQSIINDYGTDEQKKKLLPELTSGQEIAAFALTESSSGSDAASLKLSAKKTDGGYILNGNKQFITSAGIAKTYLVMARTGGEGSKGITSFIVQDGAKGFSYGKTERKMGWRSSPTRELVFENCFVPEENILGAERQGFKIAMSCLDKGRITIGAIAVGLADRAIEEAGKYALDREQFKQAIYDFQGIQFMLADMATETMASRLLVYEGASKLDRGEKISLLSSMAKLKATDVAMKVTTDAVQIFGGSGYTTEYPVERYMRDAKVLQIVEGTNQIQRVVIARQLKKNFES